MGPLTTGVAIVGHGLIGGSVALALRNAADPPAIVTIDRGEDLGPALDADLVVLAAPPLAIIDILGWLRPRLGPDTLVTDTGSTKQAIVDAASGMRFIGGHPVAGAAASGREAARPDLFANHVWVLTPTCESAEQDVAEVEQFVDSLGASPRRMDAGAHDRLFAFISHLPQLTISALMDTVGANAGTDDLRLAGAGLRDSTRLAASPPEIWREIMGTNRDNVTAALDALIARLVQLRSDPSGETMAAVFERARGWKAALDTQS